MANRANPREGEIYRAYLDAVGLHSLAAASAAGLQATEWYALSQLAFADGLTSGQLSERTGLTTGATTRLIDRLERAGYVRRVADAADRRKVIVQPVTEALEGIADLVAPARRTIAAVLDRYTPEQRAVLFDYFEHAAPAFREATEQIRAGNVTPS
ncbi:MarR family transcriptional regulator [Streptomyces sp. WAC 04229]|uniref:MarR family transcriptional regulator n=1 Tax=Streptomyces sp. WAC 04229 TaxID=2203206 RepID=UPI000F7474F6|nr:MarR family transcriptional regulator [Streptomyces sp. WAC 04229]RSN51825.1 MarR family transcriptional regulator [Streptomyces sp. WAC 04229]